MEMRADPDRVSSLHMRLLEEHDPLKRAALHLELATLQMSNGQFEQAGRHFREALHLDATLEVARQRLHELGVVGKRQKTGLRNLVSRLWGRPPSER